MENPEDVSPEMVQRIIGERDQARTERDQLKEAAEAALRIDKAYGFFAGKDGVADPYRAAKAAANAVGAPAEGEELDAKLETWWTEQSSIFAPPPPPPASEEPAKDTEPTTTPPPPGAARPAPSPSNGGSAAQGEKLTFDSPEVQKALAQGNQGFVKQLISEGRFEAHPGNPYARQG
jgi:hypothetical protein